MTDFETAARKAAEEINNGLCFTCTGEEQRKTDADCITKHCADLEETYDKLTKLAFIVLQAEFVWADMRTERRIQEMMIDPAIAALLAEKKGCGNE